MTSIRLPVGPPVRDPHLARIEELIRANQLARPYNAKLLGCKADGATDDRPRLNYIANTLIPSAGGDLELPPGTYSVQSALTIPSNVRLRPMRGAQLKPASGVTVTINGPVEAGLHQWIDVSAGGSVVLGSGSVERFLPQWWGAKGDGSTNDRAAIQAALDAANAAGGGTVRIPKSSSFYRVTGTLTVYSNTHLRGDGFGSEIRLDSDVFQKVVTTAESASGVVISDLTVNANKSGNSFTVASTQDDQPIHLNQCADSKVLRVQVKNAGSNAINLYWCTDCEVGHCTVENAYDEAIFVRGSDNWVHHNRCEVNSTTAFGDGINVWGYRNDVTDNHITGGASAITIGDFTQIVDDRDDSTVVRPDYNKVCRNVSRNSLGSGITLLGCRYTDVTENTVIDSASSAIMVRPAKITSTTFHFADHNRIAFNDLIRTSHLGAAAIRIDKQYLDAATSTLIDANDRSQKLEIVGNRSVKYQYCVYLEGRYCMVRENRAEHDVSDTNSAEAFRILEGYNEIVGNHATGHQSGLRLTDTGTYDGHCRIADNSFILNRQYGMLIEADDNQVLNNRCIDNSQQSTGTFDGIQVNGDRNLVEGNISSNVAGATQRYGILIVSGGTGNRLGENVCTSNATSDIRDDTTNSVGRNRMTVTFFQDNVAASQTDVALSRGLGAVNEMLLLANATVRAIGVFSNEARTAGTLTADVTINGTKQGHAAVLDATNTSAMIRTKTDNGLTVTRAQRLGVELTTDATWAPTTADIIVEVLLEF